MSDTCQQRRIGYVDIAKGIAIIAMVYGHILTDSIWYSFIYLFHMPLFFIVSGMCFKQEYLSNTQKFIVGKIKGIWVPYFLSTMLMIALHNVFVNAGFLQNSYCLTDYLRSVFSFLFFLDANEIICGPYWFFKQLLLSSIIFYLLNITTLRKKCVTIILLLLSFYYHIYLQKFCGVLVYYNPFFFALYQQLGYLYVKYEYKIPRFRSFYVLLSVLVIIGCYINSSIVTVNTFMIVPYLITSCASVYLVLSFSKIIQGFGNYMACVFSFVGRHTLSVLVFHILCFYVVSYLIVIAYDLEPSLLKSFPLPKSLADRYWLIYLITGVGLPIALSLLWHKCKMLLIDK